MLKGEGGYILAKFVALNAKHSFTHTKKKNSSQNWGEKSCKQSLLKMKLCILIKILQSNSHYYNLFTEKIVIFILNIRKTYTERW